MKIIFLSVIVVLTITSCSAPKYTASFSDHQGKVAHNQKATLPLSAAVDQSNAEPQILASTSSAPLEIKRETNPPAKIDIQVDKRQRKEAIKKLRSDIKTYVKEQKKLAHESSYQDFEWDNDLKLAVIFGAAGLVGVLLGGISVVFSIVGGIALIIAVVFFVQWVLRQ